MNRTYYDIIGIGIGPTNLSFAALQRPIKSIKSLFIDKNKFFIWHEGMLLEDAMLQVSFLKDLVSLINPTNEFSFLNFLAKKGRLYQFSIAGINYITRKEFDQYYKWVVSQLDNLKFDTEVLNVLWQKDKLLVQTTQGVFQCRDLVIGAGLVPYIPRPAQSYLGPSVFHSSDFNRHKRSYAGKRVTVVGSGQSGAEIVEHLVSLKSHEAPARIDWISRRYNLLPMDDSPFTNELYTPEYSDFFFDLVQEKKNLLLNKQKYTSDGISESLLRRLYQKLYDKELVSGAGKLCHFHLSCELKDVIREGMDYKLIVADNLQDSVRIIDTDMIILATGYQEKLPDFLRNIEGEYKFNNQLVKTNKDFSLPWQGDHVNRIYIQNGARKIWGVPNPNLSLNAWRAATILNSILREEYYPTKTWENQVVQWNNAPADVANPLLNNKITTNP